MSRSDPLGLCGSSGELKGWSWSHIFLCSVNMGERWKVELGPFWWWLSFWCLCLSAAAWWRSSLYSALASRPSLLQVSLLVALSSQYLMIIVAFFFQCLSLLSLYLFFWPSGARFMHQSTQLILRIVQRHCWWCVSSALSCLYVVYVQPLCKPRSLSWSGDCRFQKAFWVWQKPHWHSWGGVKLYLKSNNNEVIHEQWCKHWCYINYVMNE